MLAGLDNADVAPSRQNFAERWSPWLDWTDAIALSAVLQGGAGAAPAAAATDLPARARALTEALERVRAALARAIGSDAELAAALPLQPGADFAPMRRRYLAHQRAMDARIGPLRASLRAALTQASPRLARLAALDEVLDQALRERARHLLSTVPARLERQLEPLAGARVRGLLLAELDLRLQPVQGLLDALKAAAAGAA